MLHRAAAELASVLLVDDHPANLLAFEAVLEPLGVRLIRATSGAAAVEVAEREDLALVLLDLQMPDLDGYETAARLKLVARSRPLPVIIVTASSPSEPELLRGYATGAVDFLSKPIDPDVLRTKAAVFVDLYEERVAASREEQAADSGRQVTGRASHAALVDALGRLHAALSSSLDAQVVAGRFADEVVALTAARGAAVHYAREAKTVVAFAGALRNEIHGLDPSCALLFPVREGDAVRAGDIRLGCVQSLLAVPIKARSGGVAGMLVLVHEDPDAFDDHDEDVAMVAARHAGTSLDVALLYEEADEARHRAELAELESRATAARLRLALESTELGTWDVAPDIGRVRCDDVCRRLVGLDDGDMAVGDFFAAVDARDRDRIALALDRVFADGVPDAIFDDEFRASTPDGDERWIAARGRALGDQGRCARFIGTLRDVTDSKRRAVERAELLDRERAARTEAEDARARAEVASRVKDDFLATVSHELRTPLNAILGWSQLLLEREVDDARVEKGLLVIARNARSQLRVVDDVLDVSRIISGKLRLDVDVVDMCRAVILAVESVRPSADAKELGLETSVADEALEVIADPNRIQQVLWNLLANAVKFTPRGGRVRCTVTRRDDSVFVTVTDTGVGIEAAFVPYVFDRFRQADASPSRRFGGLGLGLAIVRHMIEMQGGEVDVESAGLGLGATFTVRLPLMSAGRMPPARARSSTLPPPRPAVAVDGTVLSGVHALVVEDDETLRELVSVILADAGAAVSPVPGVAEAMSTLHREPPDVVISDIAIAREDGISFVRRVRESDDPRIRRLPMLALTAYARPEDAERILAAGFDRHVAKPVAPKNLVEIVGELVGRGPGNEGAS